MTIAFISLFWIALAALAGPLLARVSRSVVPEVVVLLVLGMVIGPNVLHLASTEHGVEVVREIGLGLLFLLAGLEIDPRLLRARTGRHAILTWVLCLGIAFGFAWLLVPDVSFPVASALAIALTSTALGTLLPILKERGGLDGPLGRAVLVHGAIGELGPILAMALLLSARSVWASIVVLGIFAVGAAVVAIVPRRVVARSAALRAALRDGAHTTSQTAVRVVFLGLLALMALAAIVELDIVLGAFAAGFIVRALMPPGHHWLEERIEAVSWGFFVPVFFVTSGMAIDPAGVAKQPLLLVSFLLLIVLARGLPVWLRERFGHSGSGIEDRTDQVKLGLYAATGLPIIVAVTGVAVPDLMPASIASVLVAAGAASVLIFPLIVTLLPKRTAANSS